MSLKSKFPLPLRQVSIRGAVTKLALLPFAAITSLFLFSLRPIYVIRIVWMGRNIGQSTVCTELERLQTLKFNNKNFRKMVTIFYADGREVNEYLRKFWRQNALTIRGNFGYLLNKIYGRYFSPVTNPRHKSEVGLVDFEGLLCDSRLPIPEFTKRERDRGEEFVDSVCPSGKFVCLHVRDAAYYSFQKKLVDNSAFHFYRDSDIASYSLAAKALAEMGYTVFRMGARVNKTLISEHPGIIDYATNGMRTDFLDFYLGAKCAFCISTGSGWDGIPTIFRRPIMFVNALPTFAPSILCLNSLIFPKTFVQISSRFSLSLRDLAEKNLVITDRHMIYADENGKAITDFTNVGVEIRDLSSEELVEAVTEMAQRVEGTFVETLEQKEMQAKLKHILSTHPKLQPSPNYYPIRAQFASCFLSRYPNFMYGLD